MPFSSSDSILLAASVCVHNLKPKQNSQHSASGIFRGIALKKIIVFQSSLYFLSPQT